MQLASIALNKTPSFKDPFYSYIFKAYLVSHPNLIIVLSSQTSEYNLLIFQRELLLGGGQ